MAEITILQLKKIQPVLDNDILWNIPYSISNSFCVKFIHNLPCQNLQFLYFLFVVLNACTQPEWSNMCFHFTVSGIANDAY